MSKIIKGFCLIGSGILDLIKRVFQFIGSVTVGVVAKLVRAHRRRKLQKATAYVNKYGFELDLNSRVKLDGRSYYVFALNYCRDVEERREVEVALIGVPQYKEIKRRIKKKAV